MKIRKIGLYLVGLALLVWLIARSDTQQLINTLVSLRVRDLLVLVSMQMVTILLITLQWRMIAKHINIAVGYPLLLSMNMAGTFIESVTPAVKSGGEATKVLFLQHHGQKASSGSALVIAQKVLSLVFFTFTLLASLILFIVVSDTAHHILRPVVYGAATLVFFLALTALFFLWISKTTNHSNRILLFFKEINTTLTPLKKNKHLYFAHTLLGVCIWSLYGLKAVVLLTLMQIDIPMVYAPIATYGAYIVSMIPFTPGGLGTFEAVFTQILSLGGVSLATALSVVITLRLVTFWFTLLVSTLWLMVYKKRGKAYE